ncbi:VanZ family protein [Salinicola aestuarinus]|uniref:VanZ family protein n=1 Tax=Salinicola aestuarinus TaxID=1949082 RepID=UPI000DA139AE|nr:VanZ family protein [Salinicola aestuarinus]
MKRGRLIAVALTLGWALAITWGSLTPGSSLPSDLPWDKFNHFVGYGGLAMGLSLTGLRPRWAVGLAILYGIAVEYAQLAVPGRSGGDWADILANSLGAVAGTLFAMLIRGLYRRRLASC